MHTFREPIAQFSLSLSLGREVESEAEGRKDLVICTKRERQCQICTTDQVSTRRGCQHHYVFRDQLSKFVTEHPGRRSKQEHPRYEQTTHSGSLRILPIELCQSHQSKPFQYTLDQ